LAAQKDHHTPPADFIDPLVDFYPQKFFNVLMGLGDVPNCLTFI